MLQELPLNESHFMTSLLCIFVIHLLFFIFAFVRRTDKLTNLAYGLSFVLVAMLIFYKEDHISFRPLLLNFMIALWGIRLTTFLFFRILQMERDWRFDGIRGNFFKLGGFWLIQLLVVWIVLTPVCYALSVRPQPFEGLWDLLGLMLWFAGFIIESCADYQKQCFYADTSQPKKWIEEGLWGYIRHPNYLGEVLVWSGIFVVTIPVQSAWSWLSAFSPLCVFMMIYAFSGVPPIRKRMEANYGHLSEFQDYKGRTGLFLPRLRVLWELKEMLVRKPLV